MPSAEEDILDIKEIAEKAIADYRDKGDIKQLKDAVEQIGNLSEEQFKITLVAYGMEKDIWDIPKLLRDQVKIRDEARKCWRMMNGNLVGRGVRKTLKLLHEISDDAKKEYSWFKKYKNKVKEIQAKHYNKWTLGKLGGWTLAFYEIRTLMDPWVRSLGSEIDSGWGLVYKTSEVTVNLGKVSIDVFTGSGKWIWNRLKDMVNKDVQSEKEFQSLKKSIEELKKSWNKEVKTDPIGEMTWNPTPKFDSFQSGSSTVLFYILGYFFLKRFYKTSKTWINKRKIMKAEKEKQSTNKMIASVLGETTSQKIQKLSKEELSVIVHFLNQRLQALQKKTADSNLKDSEEFQKREAVVQRKMHDIDLLVRRMEDEAHQQMIALEELQKQHTFSLVTLEAVNEKIREIRDKTVPYIEKQMGIIETETEHFKELRADFEKWAKEFKEKKTKEIEDIKEKLQKIVLEASEKANAEYRREFTKDVLQTLKKVNLLSDEDIKKALG